MSDELVYDGLDTLRALLSRHSAALGYVILDEVVHRQLCTQIARVNFNEEDLRGHLVGDLDLEPLDEEQEEEEDVADQPTEEGTTDLSEAAGELGQFGLNDEVRRLCEAVLRWVRRELQPIMAQRPRCTFKLRLYRPKGEYIVSSHFKVENPNYRPPRAQKVENAPATVPSPTAPEPATAQPQLPVVVAPQLPALLQPPPPVQIVMPAPAPIQAPRSTPAVAIALGGDGHGQLVYLDPETIPEARVWRALGKATEDLLGTVGKTYGTIIELQARTVTHQSEQIDKSQRLVENLAGQLLVARQVQHTDESEQKADEQQLRIREELGKTFLNELGSFGRLLASSKLGMAPELAELGDLIGTSPELAEAIRDPNVRAMLKDDKTRRELAQLLLIASKRPSPSTGGSPPEST